MAFSFKVPPKTFNFLRRPLPPAVWLQLCACAVVGWSLLHGGLTVQPAAEPGSGAGESDARVGPPGQPGAVGGLAAGVISRVGALSSTWLTSPRCAVSPACVPTSTACVPGSRCT